MNFNSVEDILDFAIGKEEEAAQFYIDLAARMDRPAMSEVFTSFAKEEIEHKAKLLAVKGGRKLSLGKKKVVDLKIGDYLVEVNPSSELDYKQALTLAMKSEKKAYKLYNDLAQATDNTEYEKLFLSLAQEEAKHKLRFEIEYDDQFLGEI